MAPTWTDVAIALAVGVLVGLLVAAISIRTLPPAPTGESESP